MEDQPHVEKKHHATPRKQIKPEVIWGGVAALVAILIIINGIQAFRLSGLLDAKLLEMEEKSILPRVEVTVLTDSRCSDCYDITSVANQVFSAAYNITGNNTIDLASGSSDLIQKYNIERLPTVIITGETSAITRRGFELKDDALVYTGTTAPFVDAKTGAVKGRVTSIVLRDPTCTSCFDLGQIVPAAKQYGVKVTTERTVDSTSGEGQQLMSDYDITTLPAVIFSEDFGLYTNDLVSQWGSLGSVETDGNFVTRLANPPFVNVSTGTVVGLVELITLDDEACETCYDPETFYKPIITRMGVAFASEQTLDVSSAQGRQLVQRYGITQVPTILIKGDVEVYPVLVNAWTDVGDVATDGTYVFRRVEVVNQPYRDLETGSVVAPQATSAQAQAQAQSEVQTE